MTRFLLIPLLLAFLMPGCTAYTHFEGEVINYDDQPHTYEVHVTYARYGSTQREWNDTIVVKANEKQTIRSYGGGEGGYTIQALIDGNQTAIGQTTFQKDEGPGGFTINTMRGGSQHQVTYWHR